MYCLANWEVSASVWGHFCFSESDVFPSHIFYSLCMALKFVALFFFFFFFAGLSNGNMVITPKVWK